MPSSFSTRALVAVAGVVALAAVLWLAVLSPKRQQADELSKEVDRQQQVLSEAQAKATEALAAKHDFAKDYRQSVVLGKAVPESDETASLLVLLNRVSGDAHVGFENLVLNAGEAIEAGVTTATEAGPTSAPEPVSPTEAEAALLPLGASVGTANLAVMPYNLSFDGNFFHIADFIHGIEHQVQTTKNGLVVEGRLITLDGFSLKGEGSPRLTAEFNVTAYLTPPSTSEGTTSTGVEGAVPPTAPEGEAETATGTPSAFETGAAR